MGPSLFAASSRRRPVARRTATLAVVVLLMAAVFPAGVAGQSSGSPPLRGPTPLANGEAPDVIEASSHAGPKVAPTEFSGDVRDLPSVPSSPGQFDRLEPVSVRKPLGAAGSIPDIANLSLGAMPAPIRNFAGMSSADGGSYQPPDVNGDVGPNHYIQAVNAAFAIYSKSGVLLASFTENALWAGRGGTTPCENQNHGDPVVIYDQKADRWFLTNFAFPVSASGVKLSPFYECIAVSKTGDPVAGGWYFYTLRTDTGVAGGTAVGLFADYPKFGVWIDCLYMTANLFDPTAPVTTAFRGTLFASLSLGDMESGAELTWALGTLDTSTFTVIPSNLSGTPSAQLPAAGTPNYLVSESRTTSAFEVRKFTPGPDCGGGGSLTVATNVSQTSYSTADRNIVAQPNTTTLVDSGGDQLWQKVQYRKIGTAESLWVVHSVRTSSSSTVRPQWAQLNVTGGAISTTPVQQQIYAPDTTLNRWMGSIAADHQGNVALGYSTSNGTSPNFPSIAYSGRLASDPLNTLPQTEVQLIAGSGSQTTSNRWGDYTSMSIDPSDNCTFWYTNQYYAGQANGTSGNWQTRIGSFKFPTCGTTGTPPAAPTNSTATVLSSSSIRLNWTDVAGETSYNIMNWTSATGWVSIGTAAQNAVTVNVTGLSPSTIYYHSVCAVNAAGSTCAPYTTATTLN